MKGYRVFIYMHTSYLKHILYYYTYIHISFIYLFSFIIINSLPINILKLKFK